MARSSRCLHETLVGDGLEVRAEFIEIVTEECAAATVKASAHGARRASTRSAAQSTDSDRSCPGLVRRSGRYRRRVSSHTPLLERGDALDRLGAAIRNASGGAGRVVLLAGEAGIGKTTVVRRLVADTDPGLRVLWAGCDDLTVPEPLAPIRDIADHGDGWAKNAIPDADGGGPRQRHGPGRDACCSRWPGRTCPAIPSLPS
jgi:hypothetical protein